MTIIYAYVRADATSLLGWRGAVWVGRDPSLEWVPEGSQYIDKDLTSTMTQV